MSSAPVQESMAGVSGHHSGEGRNIAAEGTGLGGKDIFFAAVQMTRMPMCLADPNQPDMPLVFVNEAFQQMTGYPEAEILGRNCRFLQGPDTDPAAIQQIRAAIAGREDLAIEFINYKRDGSPFWNALYLSPVFDADGHLIYFFASQLDVTRRREAEMVLQQSQRMEALGSMASGVAHEFNNLMTVVVGSTQQAMARAVDARQHTQLARVETAARQAGRLTQQILSFARRQFHDPQPADLNELLRDSDDLLSSVLGPAMRVEVQLAATPCPVCLDAGQLELALVNLVRNASEAMAQHGGDSVTIRTERVSALPDGDRIALSVIDTGVGMAPDVLRRAAEPFFTTKGQDGGAGLGLSMVAGFAAQSGGRLQVASEPGQGTTVTMLFPVHDPAGRGESAHPPSRPGEGLERPPLFAGRGGPPPADG